MALDPNNIETVTVPELDTLAFSINSLLAHYTGGQLGKNTVAELVNVIAPYIAAVGGSGFVAIPSTNVLPNNTAAASQYTLVGAGTFTQTTGGNIVTTAPLNILTWNGTTWSLNKAIPIDLTALLSKTSIAPASAGFATSSYMKAADVNLFPSAAWTIEMYVKFNNVTAIQQVMFNGLNMPSLFINGNRIYISKAGALNAGNFFVSAYLNLFAHIVLSFDGTVYTLKINDTTQTVTIDNAGVTYSNTVNDLHIGASNPATLFANMDMAIFRVYNRVLSGAEITARYNAGLPHLFNVPKESGLMAEYLGENASSRIWLDSSIYGNVGDMIGAPTVTGEQSQSVLTRKNMPDAGLTFVDGTVDISPLESIFPTSNAWTFETYINFSDVSGLQGIFSGGFGKPSLIINAGNIVVAKTSVVSTLSIPVNTWVGKKQFLVITFNAGVYKVYLNGVVIAATTLDASTFATSIDNILIGGVNGVSWPLKATVYLFRVYGRVLTENEILAHYNAGMPNSVKAPKEDALTLELHGENASSSLWYDTAKNNLTGIIFGNTTTSSNAPGISGGTGSITTKYLEAIPSKIHVAVGREFNLWFDTIIPSYSKNLRISVNCSKGASSERFFRYTPTIAETLSCVITVKTLDNLTIESKTIELIGVAKASGSTVYQILEVGDSTRDNLNANDYPVVPAGRTRYEYMHELYDLIIAGGKFVPLFLGTRGVSPYKHQAVSGWGVTNFVGNNPSYPNPFWDGTRTNLKNWMSVNGFFGGSDKIDIISVQLGINDLKQPTITVASVLEKYKLMIDSWLHPTYGYPTAKVLISLSPFACLDRSGWALHFNATSDYDLYVQKMLEFAKGLIKEYQNNVTYPNVYICPTMLWVDRKFGYPSAQVQASNRTTETEFQFTDSVHPSTSGYKQAADAEYSNILRII